MSWRSDRSHFIYEKLTIFVFDQIEIEGVKLMRALSSLAFYALAGMLVVAFLSIVIDEISDKSMYQYIGTKR